MLLRSKTAGRQSEFFELTLTAVEIKRLSDLLEVNKNRNHDAVW